MATPRRLFAIAVHACWPNQELPPPVRSRRLPPLACSGWESKDILQGLQQFPGLDLTGVPVVLNIGTNDLLTAWRQEVVAQARSTVKGGEKLKLGEKQAAVFQTMLDGFQSNVADVLTDLRSKNCPRVILMTPTPLDLRFPQSYHRKLRQWIMEQQSDFVVPVDCWRPFMRRVGPSKERYLVVNQQLLIDRYGHGGKDGIHWTKKGQALIKALVLEAMRR